MIYKYERVSAKKHSIGRQEMILNKLESLLIRRIQIK